MTSPHFLHKHFLSNPVDISFFIPCYNEEKNIESVIHTIVHTIKHFPNLSYEILVFDDGSKDRTSQVVLEFIEKRPDFPISLVQNFRNCGLGHNYLRGAQLARGKYYMLVNGDNDLHEKFIIEILKCMGQANIIIPYITNQKDRPIARYIISQLYTLCVNILSGHILRYYNGQVLHLKSTILALNIKTGGFGYQAELICEALRRGFSYHELGIKAQIGPHYKSSAFTFKNIVAVSQSLARIFFRRLNGQSRPALKGNN